MGARTSTLSTMATDPTMGFQDYPWDHPEHPRALRSPAPRWGLPGASSSGTPSSSLVG
uniref:Uncharacterized protein n=1 Tax=Arundo donax TaxID=35708 RepID=A0A0A9A8F7_ARUDO